MTKNNFLYYTTFFFVIFLFTYLFYLSTKYVINYWTFSQAHINYSDGFVKRGLFGTIALYIENKFNIKFINLFNFFFIFFYFLNLILYFRIIKNYVKFNILFIFLALSPTLIVFSFNDLGGFQRFDAISIFLILFHSYIINLTRSKKITFRNYRLSFILIIFPISLISIFVHEIHCWSIPFHFFLIRTIYNESNKKLNELYYYFSILIIISISVLAFPIDETTINSMINKLKDRELWDGAIKVASSSEGNLNIIKYEINTNLLTFYNFKINLFFLIMGVLPFQLLLIYFNNKKIIKIENKKYYISFYLSIAPYLTFFAIGDTGRWLHIISIISFSFFAQYPITKTNLIFFKNRTILFKIVLIIFLIVYCFFIRLPHGGNLQEKKISIWGGLNKKFEAAYMIYFGKNIDEKFNLNKRFKKKNGK